MGTPRRVYFSADKTLAGVPQLLDDLQRLLEDKESADIVLLVGREEVPFYAHKLILMAREKKSKNIFSPRIKLDVKRTGEKHKLREAYQELRAQGEVEGKKWDSGGFYELRCKSFQSAKRGEICRIPGSTVVQSAPGTPTPIRLPHFQPEIFRHFLQYVYTGKILLTDSGVFDTMSMAQDLGLEELIAACEDHVTSTLSTLNACTFLAALENQTAGKGTKSFVEKCVGYIGENASECVKTKSFLNLPKEALIKLISSDSVALEEEDVWRAVLNWAKYHAGVTQPTAHWTEEERARVCQHLTGVINHVRLLLIDSQVFAEEVEPTGAVPMELSLERYRFAALPYKFRENTEDKRLQPRVSLKLFPGSQILSQDKCCYQRVLNSWFGHPKQVWRLLYRASSHGYSAESFHRHCDGVAPTFVIVQGNNGQICGGLSDVPWGKGNMHKVHSYTPSDRAFLFTLVNNQDLPPTKFDIIKKPFAVCYHPDCGPVFGAGADLLISSDCNTNMESYSNLPHSYDGENASNNILMGEYHFAVNDYEVFTPVGK